METFFTVTVPINHPGKIGKETSKRPSHYLSNLGINNDTGKHHYTKTVTQV